MALEERDKAWLDAAAARDGTPATELVRRAVKLLRVREPLERQPFVEVLRRTSGIAFILAISLGEAHLRRHSVSAVSA